MSNLRGRYWCFTWNNPNASINFESLPKCRYGIAQKERGDSGTPHYQGYVELHDHVRLAHLRRWLPGAHFEPRRGTREQARDYCRKPDSRVEEPIEWGSFTAGGQGSRTDLASLKATIDSGATLLEIWDTHPAEFLKYNRGVQLAIALKTKPRTWKTKVTILIGPTGTGKSKWVYDNYSPDIVYPKQRSNWWDGYCNHKVVLMDDFYGWLPFDEMLRLMDRYPMIVQTKGGQSQFLAEDLIITSNKHPYEWYNSDKVHQRMEAFYRRIDRWLYVPEQGTVLEASSLGDFEELVKDFDQ